MRINLCMNKWEGSIIFKDRFAILKPKLHLGKRYNAVLWNAVIIKLYNYTLDAEQKYQVTVVIDRSFIPSIWKAPVTLRFMKPKRQSSYKKGASHFYASPFSLHYYFLNAPPLTHFIPIELAASFTFPISHHAHSYLRVLHRIVYPFTTHKS